MRHLRLVALTTFALTSSAFAAPTPAPPLVDELVLGSAQEVTPLVLAATADSQDGAVAPAPGVGDKLLELVLSPSGFGVLASVLGSVLALIVGTAEVRRRRVALAVYHAFHVVEDLSKETDTTADDKVAAGLRALDSYLVANGWRPLKPGEEQLAKLGFQSLNGAQVLAEKVAANAQLEATKALSSPAMRRELDAIARGQVDAAVPPSAS